MALDVSGVLLLWQQWEPAPFIVGCSTAAGCRQRCLRLQAEALTPNLAPQSWAGRRQDRGSVFHRFSYPRCHGLGCLSQGFVLLIPKEGPMSWVVCSSLPSWAIWMIRECGLGREVEPCVHWLCCSCPCRKLNPSTMVAQLVTAWVRLD